jgi:hypothetical protein
MACDEGREGEMIRSASWRKEKQDEMGSESEVGQDGTGGFLVASDRKGEQD